jgi:RluA family pseudouridine synthase
VSKKKKKEDVEPRRGLVSDLVGTKFFPVRTLIEDQNIIVVSKLRGMHCVVHQHSDPITVADCLAALAPETVNASPDKRESGLVNRIDRWTSGVLLAAKNREAWTMLREEMRADRIKKSYLAIVEGTLPKAKYTVNLPIFLVKDKPKVKFQKLTSAEQREAKKAISLVQRLKVVTVGKKKFTIVRVSGGSMTRHQVRVHLCSLGHPIVGDEMYGASSKLSDLISGKKPKHVSGEPEGFLLHAESIEFKHPKTGRMVLAKTESPAIQFLLQ